MSRTTDSITPIGFLQVLRQVFFFFLIYALLLKYLSVKVNPQFAEVDRSGKGGMLGAAGGYAQQGPSSFHRLLP